MKRFITYKKVRVPRYYFFLIMLVFLIFIVFKLPFFTIATTNTYGNLFESLKYPFWYTNAFGFSILKDNSKDKVNNLSEPQIYLYNTFQTDKYEKNYYNSYSINPVVTQASFILQEELKKLGITSIVEEESVAKVLQDNRIDYNLSYRGSRILLEKAQKKYPSLSYFFDLGIKNIAREKSTITYQEKDYARIYFIIGTDYETYRLNEALGNTLHQKLEELLPGLSNGLSLQGGEGYHGIYNEDFNAHTLLIYIGGYNNTIEEVNRTLKILAKAISSLLEENTNEKK